MDGFRWNNITFFVAKLRILFRSLASNLISKIVDRLFEELILISKIVDRLFEYSLLTFS
jgi:hypothetical protein